MSRLWLSWAVMVMAAALVSGCFTGERWDSEALVPVVEQARHSLDLAIAITEAVDQYRQEYSAWPSNGTAFVRFAAQRKLDVDWSMVTNMVITTDDAGLLHFSYEAVREGRVVGSNSVSLAGSP